MPTYTISAPDGNTYSIQGPDGATQQDVIQHVLAQYPEAGNPPVKESGVLAQGKKGLEQLVSSLQTTGGAAFGNKDEAARAALARQAEFDRKYEQSPSLERAKETFQEKGFFSGLGQLASDAPDVLAAQIPQFGLSYAGGRAGAAAGAKAGSALGPRGKMAGALLGGGAGLLGASYPGQLAGNIEAQAEEQVSTGKPIDVNLPAAAGTAVPQAAFDAASNLPFFGRGLFGKMLGIPKEVLERGGAEAVEKLAKESLAATVAKGTAVGYAVEFPTEILQQVLQRYQAGQSLTSPEAYKQYGEIAYQTALLSPLGIAGRSLDKSGAKTQVQQKVMEQRREADAAAAAAAPKPPDITDPAYLQQIQTQYQEAEQRKAALKSQLRKVQDGSVTETADRLHNKDIEEQIKAMTPELEQLAAEYNKAAKVAPAFTPEAAPGPIETPEAVKVPEAVKPTTTVGDALDNPLGRFTTEELSSRSPKIVDYINEQRTKLGKPTLNDYSIEDIRDAMPGELPDAEKADLNSLIAAKSGYTPDVTYKPEDIINVAKQKNIATDTDGFKFFLQRATGENNLTKMEQPQLHSAFTALSGLPEFDETQFLPEKTSATHYSQKQYNDAVQKVSGLVSEKDIPSSQALQVAKKATGLTRDSDVQLLLQNAYTSGDLNLSSKGDFITAQPAEQAEFRVEEGFTQAQPTGFNVMRGDQLLYSTQNEAEANAKVESLSKTADPAMKQIDKSIAGERSTVAASQRSLDIMEAAGMFRTPKYQQASAQHAALVKKSNEDIQRLNKKKAYLQQPVTIQTTGKPLNVKTYKVKEKGVSEKAFNTREEALKHALENLPAARLNELAGKTKAPGFAKRLQAEIERRKAPPKQFVAEKPEPKVEPKVEAKVEPKPETTAQKEAVKSQILPMLKKFGLGDVALQIEEGMQAEGSYAASVIKVALDAKYPVRVLRHESLHGLKDLGFFTPGQWKVLENQADKVWIDKYLKQRNINGQPIQGGQQSRFEAYQNLYDGDMDAIREEAIADAFGDFDINGAPKGLFATLLQKMQDFFRALRSAFTGAGYETADDVFGKVERGELTATKKASETAKTSVRALTPITLDTKVGQGVRSYFTEFVEPLREAVAKGSFKPISLKNGTKVNLVVGEDKVDDTRGVAVALDQENKVVGRVTFYKNETEDGIRFNPDVIVQENLRRQGLATALYDLAEEYGALIPSVDQKGQFRTEDGKAFREARASAFNPAEVAKANAYEEKNDIAPYLSVGDQYLPTTGGEKYSLKTKDKYGMYEGIPLNNDGTITVYYHTTKANAMDINKAKRISPSDDKRVYLTNESSGALVLKNKGLLPQETDGSVVMLKLPPEMMQLADRYPDGRVDMFIPLAEGDFFNKKMRVSAIQVSKNKAILEKGQTFSYKDHAARMSGALTAYEGMSAEGKKQAIKRAAEVLREQHNIGTLLTTNGKLEKTSPEAEGLSDLDVNASSMGLGMAAAQKITDKLSSCPNSAICADLCLGDTAGGNQQYGGVAKEDVNGIEKSAFRAGPRMVQYLKTEALVIHPEEFVLVLSNEIQKFKDYERSTTIKQKNPETGKRETVEAEVYEPSIRLNVTSDFSPEMFKPLFDAHPDVVFYDYTKLQGKPVADNHHLTYSSTGFAQMVDGKLVQHKTNNWNAMRGKLDSGYNVAMAFTSKSALPKIVKDEETGKTYQVWDGDNYDARYLDPKRPDGVGMIVGLRNKAGTMREKESAAQTDGFFANYDPKTDGDTVVVPDQKVLTGRKVIPIEKLSLRTAPDTPEFKRFFGDSKVVDANGEPKLMYHGTARDITTFKPKQAGAIFLTDDIDFAEGFASMSADWMAKNVDQFLTPQQKKDAVQLAIKNVKADYGKTKASVSIIKDLQSGNPTGEAMDKLVEAYREMMPSGPNVMPVYVRAEKPFDYQNPSHVNRVLSELSDGEDMREDVRGGNWQTIESESVQDAIKFAGFDSFYVKENGRKNLAVYESNQIKSATGNIGTYDINNPDIRYSLRTAPDTPEFKQWFKRSAVVDKDGKPMVVYHGTQADISEFKLDKKANRSGNPDGYYFTPRAEDASSNYAGEEGGANVMPVYLSIQNPFVQKSKVDYRMIDQYEKELRKANQSLNDAWIKSKVNIFKENAAKGTKWFGELFPNISFPTAAMTRVLEAGGYDGFKDGDHFIAIRPDQIKSAIGNRGTYDPNNPDIRYSLRTDVAEDIRNMPNGAAIEAAINRTTTARQELGYAERMTEALANRSESFSYFRQKFFDRYNRLNDVERQIAQQMGGVARLADQSAHAAALQSDAAAGVAASALGVGNRMGGMPVYRNGYTTVSNENGTVKGAVEIFSPLAKYGDPKIYQAYQFWAGAKRGKRLLASGKEELYTPQDMALAKQLEEKYPEFASVQKEWIKYNNGLVKYAVDTGVVSAQNADEFTRYSDYVPFYRQLEGERTVGPNIFQSISGVKGPQKITGSEAPLADFLETVVRNTQSIIQAGMKNVAAQKAVDGGVMIGMVRKLDHVSSAPDVVTILKNGQKVSYECADKLWVDAVSSLNLPELPFLNFIAAPANFLRTMVTKDPGFMLANLMRDSISAYVTSGAKLTPVASAVKEMTNVLMNNSPEYQKLLSAGVLGGYEFSRNIEASTEAFGKDLRKKTGTKTGFESATSPFTFFWDALEKGTEASDAATRIAVYKATLAETGNEAEAIHRALEVMNFNRKGSSIIVRVAAATIPFLNARVQGLDVFFRSGIRPFLDGNATEQEKQVQKAMIIRGMTLLGMSVMYAMAISGNPDYEKQEEETKDNNWIIPMGEGKTPLKIPIPFEVGTLFKTVPERIYRSFFMADKENRDTTEALHKSMKRALQSTFGFNPVPQIAAPLLEARDNYSVFTQRPIVGQNMQGISPEFQVGPGTSKWAEILGQQAGMSPMMIDHVFKGYTGTMGVYAADLLDAGIGAVSPSEVEKPSKRIDQMPIIKRFLADPEARGKITSYFDLKHQVDTTVRTINMLEKQADPNLPDYVEKNAQLFAARDFMNNLNKQMDDLQRQANMIRSAPIPADEKQEMLREITKAQNLLVNDIRQIRNILKP